MKGKIFRRVLVVLILFVIIMPYVSGITGSIGNARMMIRADVGEIIERSILVKNVNDVLVDIELFASGDLEDDIEIMDDEFTLAPGEEKHVDFTIEIKEEGVSESYVNVKFTPRGGGNGVALRSTVIVVVGDGTIPLFECGILDIEDGVYELQNDIVSDETCFEIEADGITLDLNGYSIRGEGEGNGYGVMAKENDFITIKNGGIYNFKRGIWFDYSSNIIIENNKISLNKEYGIWLYHTDNNRITNNEISLHEEQSNSIGIRITGIAYYDINEEVYVWDPTSENIIENNIINSNSIGISLSAIIDSIIKNNSVNSNGEGIRIIHGTNDKIIDNIIESNEHKGILINRGIPNSTEPSNNLIKNNILSSNGEGIKLIENNNNAIINNRIEDNNHKGIILDDSNYNIIEDNHVENNGGDGIFVEGKSSSNIVDNNKIYDNSHGIILHDEASLNTIKNNIIYGGGVGISLSGYDTSLNLLENNEIYNAGIGISIGGSYTNSNILKGNILHDNEYSGIKITGGKTNTIDSNEIYGNEYYGILFESILIEDFESNVIYNNFLNNTQNVKIEDDSNRIVNHWNSESIGNFWANPSVTGFSQTCEDLDRNGVCDSQYVINENNLDHFPLTYTLPDISPPIITLTSPSDDYTKRTSKSHYEIDFKYNVDDESDISSCSLIIDGDVEETDTTIQKGITNIFSVDLNRDNYDWEINCVDSEGNEVVSEVRELEIRKRSSSSSSSSSFSTTTQTTKSDLSLEETEELTGKKEINLGDSKITGEVMGEGKNNKKILVVLLFISLLLVLILISFIFFR